METPTKISQNHCPTFLAHCKLRTLAFSFPFQCSVKLTLRSNGMMQKLQKHQPSRIQTAATTSWGSSEAQQRPDEALWTVWISEDDGA